MGAILELSKNYKFVFDFGESHSTMKENVVGKVIFFIHPYIFNFYRARAPNLFWTTLTAAVIFTLNNAEM